MAYIKTDWTDGMVISEAGLDHLENGVYNNSVAIGDLTDLDTTDKTNLVAAINEAAQSGGGGGGMSNAVKDALLQIAAKVAYIDEDGQEYYDDLYDALYPGATIVSINADYTQTGTVYPTASLDDLRNDLVVNAIYDNGSVVPVISYTLSGTLEEGTSTITVTYEGFTDTFDVEVTAAPTLSSIAAVYTQSGTVYDTDSLDSLKADLVVTATYSDSSTATVPSADYTLSGTLTEGTSTITVTYESKTTTFNVTVTGWDFAWDFSMGKLEEQTGWTVDKSSSGISSSLDSVGEKIVNSTTSAKYFQMIMAPDGSLASLRTMSNGYGVVEALVSTTTASTQNAGRLRVYAAKTSGVSIVVLASDGKWKIRTSSTAADCPDIGDCSSGVDYLIRLVMKDTAADVYINGTLAAQNVDTSTMVSASSNGIILNPENNGKYVYIKAFRIRTGGV